MTDMLEIADREIWVFGDLRNERFFGFGLNVLAKARVVAQPVQAKVVMVLIGLPDFDKNRNDPVSQAFVSVAAAEEMCLGHGADKVYVYEVAHLKMPRADIYAHVMANAVLKQNPMLVLFAMTDFGRELASRTAGLRKAGLLADCLDLRIENGEIVASSPSWGGEIMAELTFSDKRMTGFATVQPQAHRAVEARGMPGTVIRAQVSFPDETEGIEFL
jgi:electron transfer flavoprotein alpha subunit